ncbi:MAG: mevalonate kinase [Oligoflexales bacterium]
MFLEVQTPGKVMLVGEYVALKGAPVLSVAVGPGLKVIVETQPTNHWVVSSELWKKPRTLSLLENCPDHAKEPLLACLWEVASLAKQNGGTLRVESSICVEDGMGSSSALRLAVASAFSKLADLEFDPLRLAWEWQRKSQKHASGYDVITQYHGGCLKMEDLHDQQSWPGLIQKFDLKPLIDQLHLWCGGVGAPTGPVMKDTMAWLDTKPSRWDKLQDASRRLTESLEKASTHGLWEDCYVDCGRHRQCFEGSPHYPQRVADQLDSCEGVDKKWSYKFTGAGGEDAILMMGDKISVKHPSALLTSLGWKKTDKKFSDDGIQVKVRKS